MSIKFDDVLLELFLLLSLPESWETFRVSITSSTPRGVVSLETTKGGILNKEMRRKAHGYSSQPEVLVIGNWGEVIKRNRMVVERILEESSSRDTRIWSVIIIIKCDTYKSIVISGKEITARRVSLNKETMKITMMIVLLFVYW